MNFFTCHLEPGECNQGDVRLVNGSVAREGWLEICGFGVWGRVCAQHFSKSAARIACIQANYTDVKGLYYLILSIYICSCLLYF